MLQLSSSIFTVQNLELEQFSERNEDVFFTIYNSFNDMMMAINQSATYY